jgi:DNA polymerase sigma
MQEQTPGPQDAARRRQILEKLGGIVGAGLDGHTELRVEPYGSFVSGLYSPTGDLDISIEGNCGKEYVAHHMSFVCCKLYLSISSKTSLIALHFSSFVREFGLATSKALPYVKWGCGADC